MLVGVPVFESLKKRRAGVFRSVPGLTALLDTLDMVYGIRDQQGRHGKGRGVRLWPRSRITGRRSVHAGGVPGSPEGLWHDFRGAAVMPASHSTWCRNGSATRSSARLPFFANAVGAEEKNIARRIWDK
jgi:integrase/recombinase XerD